VREIKLTNALCRSYKKNSFKGNKKIYTKLASRTLIFFHCSYKVEFHIKMVVLDKHIPLPRHHRSS
jgi:hypothetical protein